MFQCRICGGASFSRDGRTYYCDCCSVAFSSPVLWSGPRRGAVLSDQDIDARRCLGDGDPMRLRIEPFVCSSPKGCVSYGLSSGGYDVRCGRDFMVFTDVYGAVVDPKALRREAFVEMKDVDRCIIPGNSFALACSVERFRIPRDVIATCIGKSTYHRCGVIAACTPLEPEWEGHITLEISNTTPCPAMVYAGEGVLQVLFNILSSPCRKSYLDKGGRYQGQVGITLPFVG